MRDTLRRSGPRLVHFVAAVPEVRAAAASWQEQDIERGEVVAASRMTARGLLQWQITIRNDGQRLYAGVLPTLIQWGATHPAPGLPESGVTLHAVLATHPEAARLQRAWDAIGLQGVALARGTANLCAVLDTPRGRVRLESGGL